MTAERNRPDARLPTGALGALLVARLLTELALVAVLAVAGAGLGGGLLASVALAVVLPAAAVVLWGLFIAPAAERRMVDPARLYVELALFAASAVALAGAGHMVWAVLFAVVAVGVAVAVRLCLPGS